MSIIIYILPNTQISTDRLDKGVDGKLMYFVFFDGRYHTTSEIEILELW